MTGLAVVLAATAVGAWLAALPVLLAGRRAVRVGARTNRPPSTVRRRPRPAPSPS